jgi:hypothetical protein
MQFLKDSFTLVGFELQCLSVCPVLQYKENCSLNELIKIDCLKLKLYGWVLFFSYDRYIRQVFPHADYDAETRASLFRVF